MERYRAIYTHKDCGNYIFTVLDDGKILCPTGREVGFHHISDVKVGECFKIEFVPEGTGYYDNPYCRIVEKVETKSAERLNNLLENLKFTIDVFYSTDEECKQVKYQLDNGVYYVEDIYFMLIRDAIGVIAKFFSSEKKPQFAKQIKEVYNEFYNKRFSLLGVAEGSDTFYGDNYNIERFLKDLKKQKYSFFTSYQKIVDDIRSAIKSSAMQSYDKIKDISNLYLNNNKEKGM